MRKKVIEKLLKNTIEQIKTTHTEEPHGFWSVIVNAIGTHIVPVFVGAVLLLSAVLLCVIAIIGIIVSIVTFVTETILLDNLGGLTGGDTTQVAGSQYVWNETDLNKMPDEWSKNLYRLGWIITENKEIQFSDMSTALLMGLPVSETSSSFFPTGDDHYNPPNITGKGQNWNNYSIAEYATVGGAFPYNTKYDYITGLYATDATYLSQIDLPYGWGCPASETLDTTTIGPIHEGYIQQYANGDVNKSAYSVAYSVANTIHAYEMYRNTSLTTDADKGYTHKYKKYWEKAAEKYQIDSNDIEAQQAVYNLLYYWIHGGGVWSTDIADEFAYMALDYVTYVYTQLLGSSTSNIRLVDKYSSSTAIKNIGTYVTRASVRGVANVNHDGASVWNEPTYTTTSGENTPFLELYIDGDWVALTEPVVQLWMQYNQEVGTADALKLIETYKKAYLHNDKILVRQACYTVSTGVSTIAVGMSRLKYIFDIIGVEITINDRGFVCYVGTSGESGSVPQGYYDGDFDGTKQANGMSNYRDASWFAKIDNTEWSNPLNPNLNGGLEVTSRYGYRQYNGLDWHSGFDMVYKNRSSNLTVLKAQYPLYAMHSGTVVAVNRDISSTAGRYIHYKVVYYRNEQLVTHYITYMHMSEIPDNIVVGAEIKQGEIVGYMGGSGNGSELGYDVHLHISLSTNPSVNGTLGRLDVETELPFVTMYPGYTKWFGTQDSGCLKQRPAYPLAAGARDPQSQ